MRKKGNDMSLKLTTTKHMKSEIFTPITPPMVWTPLEKALSECKVGLASACGVHRKDDTRFGYTGDSSWRLIPKDIDPKQLMVTHGGYDNSDVNKDINCMFPYQRINELVADGFIKEAADIHVGFMGGGGIQTEFKEKTGPNIANIFKEQGVDIVILTAG